VTLADEPIFSVTVPGRLQTYMAAGRPILASLNGEGARLVIEAEAGLAAPAEDPRALADAVLQLYRMAPAEREKMGTNGRQYFSQYFDRELLVDKLLDHFRSIISPKVND